MIKATALRPVSAENMNAVLIHVIKAKGGVDEISE